MTTPCVPHTMLHLVSSRSSTGDLRHAYTMQDAEVIKLTTPKNIALVLDLCLSVSTGCSKSNVSTPACSQQSNLETT